MPMTVRQFERLNVLPQRDTWVMSRAWREWCFLRVVWRRVRWRLAILLVVLVSGARLFMAFEPTEKHSFLRAMYFMWLLIFGEPPEDFPTSRVLQATFFVTPLLGLAVILEGIVDFALILRDRRRNEHSWCKTMAASLSNHIVLVGLGKLGYRTYRLLRRLGEPVVVIESEDDSPFLSEVRRDGSPLLIGDARRDALLEEANVAKARSIILATNNDLVNLEAALDARRINPKVRVVMRLFDQNLADKVRDGFNITAAMSQSAISAPTFVMAAVEESIVNSMVINDELVVMQRWFVKQHGPLCEKSVAEVMEEFGVGVVERRPAGGDPQLFPPSDTRLCVGDELLVQGRYETLAKLRTGADEHRLMSLRNEA